MFCSTQRRLSGVKCWTKPARASSQFAFDPGCTYVYVFGWFNVLCLYAKELDDGWTMPELTEKTTDLRQLRAEVTTARVRYGPEQAIPVAKGLISPLIILSHNITKW